MDVLFVCVGNTCRSQMAEAIAKNLGHKAQSGGTNPPDSGKISENAIIVLEEIGIGTDSLFAKSVDDFKDFDFDKIVSMGCGVSCPDLPIDEDWGLEDPHGKELEAYRKTRDEVIKLISRL